MGYGYDSRLYGSACFVSTCILFAVTLSGVIFSGYKLQRQELTSDGQLSWQCYLPPDIEHKSQAFHHPELYPDLANNQSTWVESTRRKALSFTESAASKVRSGDNVSASFRLLLSQSSKLMRALPYTASWIPRQIQEPLANLQADMMLIASRQGGRSGQSRTLLSHAKPGITTLQSKFSSEEQVENTASVQRKQYDSNIYSTSKGEEEKEMSSQQEINQQGGLDEMYMWGVAYGKQESEYDVYQTYEYDYKIMFPFNALIILPLRFWFSWVLSLAVCATLGWLLGNLLVICMKKPLGWIWGGVVFLMCLALVVTVISFVAVDFRLLLLGLSSVVEVVLLVYFATNKPIMQSATSALAASASMVQAYRPWVSSASNLFVMLLALALVNLFALAPLLLALIPRDNPHVAQAIEDPNDPGYVLYCLDDGGNAIPCCSVPHVRWYGIAAAVLLVGSSLQLGGFLYMAFVASAGSITTEFKTNEDGMVSQGVAFLAVCKDRALSVYNSLSCLLWMQVALSVIALLLIHLMVQDLVCDIATAFCTFLAIILGMHATRKVTSSLPKAHQSLDASFPGWRGKLHALGAAFLINVALLGLGLLLYIVQLFVSELLALMVAFTTKFDEFDWEGSGSTWSFTGGNNSNGDGQYLLQWLVAVAGQWKAWVVVLAFTSTMLLGVFVLIGNLQCVGMGGLAHVVLANNAVVAPVLDENSDRGVQGNSIVSNMQQAGITRGPGVKLAEDTLLGRTTSL